MVERFLHTEEATGSIPVSPTMVFLPVCHPSRSKTAIFRGMLNLLWILDRTGGVGYTSSIISNDSVVDLDVNERNEVMP